LQVLELGELLKTDFPNSFSLNLHGGGIEFASVRMTLVVVISGVF